MRQSSQGYVLPSQALRTWRVAPGVARGVARTLFYLQYSKDYFFGGGREIVSVLVCIKVRPGPVPINGVSFIHPLCSDYYIKNETHAVCSKIVGGCTVYNARRWNDEAP